MLKKLIAKLFYRVINSGAYTELQQQLDREAFIKKFKSVGADAVIPEKSILVNPHYIIIGKNFSALNNLRLEAWDSYADEKFTPEFIIGNNVSLGTDVHIGCINKITIGNNVLMGSRVYITDHSHGEINEAALKTPPVKRKLVSKGTVTIDDNVWIGEGVCILPNVHIGKGAIIGANTVVTKDMPAMSVVAGVPGKVIKTF